jgi:hypothetical protein
MALTAISPLDGRYAAQVQSLAPFFPPAARCLSSPCAPARRGAAGRAGGGGAPGATPAPGVRRDRRWGRGRPAG